MCQSLMGLRSKGDSDGLKCTYTMADGGEGWARKERYVARLNLPGGKNGYSLRRR